MNRCVNETDFVRFMVAGGLSVRQAQCLERWIDDKRPAGISPERFVAACLQANRVNQNQLYDDRNELIETIEKLEHACDLYGVRYGMPS